MPRRTLLWGLLAAPLTVAACSGDKPKPSASSASSSPATTATATAPKVTGAGLPADLLGVMSALYLGGNVAATGPVGPALGKRTPLRTPVKVSGTTGTWKGSPIATVVQGKDVTLLVKGKTWSVVGGWWPSLRVARPAFPTMRILAIGSDARSPPAGDQVPRGRPAHHRRRRHEGCRRHRRHPTGLVGVAVVGWQQQDQCRPGLRWSQRTWSRPCPGPPGSRSTVTSSPASRVSARWSRAWGDRVRGREVPAERGRVPDRQAGHEQARREARAGSRAGAQAPVQRRLRALGQPGCDHPRRHGHGAEGGAGGPGRAACPRWGRT